MTRVHVRLTESLKVIVSRHLELSGSRVKPAAALRGAHFLRLPRRSSESRRIAVSPLSTRIHSA